MIKNKFLKNNKICFIFFFVIREDREKIAEKKLRYLRTQKILLAKKGNKKFIRQIVAWIFKELDDGKHLVLIPFPSTDKDKPKNMQLSHLVVTELCGKCKKWEDGSKVLIRAYSLPKNTRNVELQYKSLILKNPEILKGKNVIILDDVLTSGSSLLAGIRKIEEAKPKSVLGLAIAKKVYLKDIPLTGVF